MSAGQLDVTTPQEGGNPPRTDEMAAARPVESQKPSTPAQPFKLPYSNSFDVEFKDAHQLKEDRIYSEPVTFGPLKWRILLFPRGNPSSSQARGNMSAYLDVVEADAMEEGWRLQTVVRLKLRNHFCSSMDIDRSVPHKFHAQARDIGYAAFHPLKDLYDPAHGFYVNHTLKFHVGFTVTQSWVERPDDHKNSHIRWDSKAQTGYVGLQNQGATCYLNSLLQSMYHLPRFRHLVYSIPAEAHTSAESLQRLFWNLEHDDDSVSTSALTKSFGWNIEDLAVQHDVQELLRKLVDKLEEKVKESPQKGVFEQLFRGTYMDILKCINVDYERKQEIAFCDLSLNVAGCDTLEDSLRKFTETETLDGDNRYKSEEHGYQDAHKGIKLNSLPPVLHLHLKRFDYQYQNDPPTLEKVNAKQVFPPVLKMGEFLDKPIPDTDDTTYDLFGILVHSGSAQAGHYYAFLRPTTSPNWFKFDDSKVSHATVEEAIDDNFGGDEITEIKIGGKSIENAQRFATEKHSSAYMLVYVKKSEIDTVFSDTRFDSETPFVEKMTQEMKALQMEMQKRIEEAQYTEVRVSTMDCLISGPPSDYDGKLIHMFDLNKANKVRIKKDALVKHLKVEIERQLGIPAVRQRLWTLKENYDYYISLDRPITVENCNRTVLMFKSNRVSLGMEVTDLLDVFVEINDDIPTDPVDKEGESQPHLREEVDTGEDGEGESAGVKQRGFQNLEKTRLLFARYFNPEDQSFRVIGQFYFPEFHGTIDLLTDAIKPLLEREGLWTDDGELAFHLSDATTPMSDRLGNGELAMRQITAGAFITVQYLVPEDVTTIKHKTVTSYLRFLKSRISLEFHDLSNREVEPIALPFTTDTTMGEVLATLGSALGWDPKKISLIDAYPGTHHPRSTTPATFESDYTIQRAFSSATYFMHYGPVHIFYDLLDLPLDEIRGKVPAKVHFVDHKLVNHAVTLYMAPPYSAGQLAETARRNPRIAPLLISPDIPLRVFEFEEHRFTYRAKQPTEQLYSYYSQHLGIEEVYPEETSALPNFSKVIIYLLSISSSGVYTKPTHRPFTLTIAPDETIASIKNRIRARVGNTTDEIDVWVRDPAYSETQACAENQVVSELEATGLYCNLHAPRPETPVTAQATATGPAVKEKPRNTLHLGN